MPRRALLVTLVGMILTATPHVIAQPEGPPGPAPLPLGEVVVLSGPEPCDGEGCWVLEVTCPEVVEAAEVTLRVGAGAGEGRGTVLFMSGGGGTGLWGSPGPARGAVAELRGAGFRTVLPGVNYFCA
jgi:hypothetical protein